MALVERERERERARERERERERESVCVCVCVSRIGTVESRAHGDKVSLQESCLKSTL